jgi:site-specific DNA recombinase
MKAATYARYSTDKQREQSIEDQFRVAERLAERNGFQVVARFSDSAISGGTTQRPGYQSMLTAARANKFDVIVAEDTSRLWRNLAEQAPRLAELSDIGIAVVTADLDTRQESAAILGAVGGAMAEAYRREIGRRVRRGLEGLARNAKPTGGRAYGYVAAEKSGTGQVEIDGAQADVVRRIFADYAAGMSPKSIAAALNRAGVASPGSSWNRSMRRANGWMTSAIAGGPTRGLGILNNELYCGRVIWNKFRWVRSATDSSKRKCIPNARKDWIVRDDERLRIVPNDLWERVKARQRERTQAIGSRVQAGIAASAAARTGRGPKYLLSGLLQCAACGANFAMSNRVSYQCASYTAGKGCANSFTLRRKPIETALLAGIVSELSRPEVVAEARRRLLSALRQRSKAQSVPVERVAQLEREVSSLVDAIASGALRASPALANRLAAAESELAGLQNAATTVPAFDVEAITPRLVDRYRAAVASLPATLERVDIERARHELKRLIGVVQVEADDQEIRFRTQDGAVETAMRRLAGDQSVLMVAGVGFEPTTFGL